MKKYLYSLATDKRKGFFASLIKFVLLLLSFVYAVIIRALILFYTFRPVRLKCKVVSIGNITLGGTGKTSLVEFVGCYLSAKGRKLAVLSRGYKRNTGEIGDEPLMLSRNLGGIPVIVDKDRVRSARRAVEEYGVDTVILDDGLQQWRIKKDLEIVTVNATEGFGNCAMLPRGLLREPLSMLSRADIFVLTKTDLASDLNGLKNTLTRINPAALIVESVHEPLGFYDIKGSEKFLGIDYLRGKKVALFSGIGDPGSFAGLTRQLGADIGLDLRFEDHHDYSQEDLSSITAQASCARIDIIVTTEKDISRLSAEKLELFEEKKLLVLRIALKITRDEERFAARLLSLYTL